MYKIQSHPILSIPTGDEVTFEFKGQIVKAQKGYTIAAALHQAGFPIHSHSLTGRERSMDCGIGKCGACEMLVDGEVKRICITKVDGVRKVEEIAHNHLPASTPNATSDKGVKVYKTEVAIIGAGPAGLACREQLNKLNIPNIVIDNNDRIGGQFTMQTHQFFFFEKEKKYGGMRGFDIAKTLAGDDHSGILLNSTVWDILEGKRVAAKNMEDNSLFFVDANYLVVATGAFPFMPTFENDDLPGVYTAAVVQKMMNLQHTLLGKRILTIGAGNIGYLTSYQAMQAGAQVVAIVEAMDHEGGFPVQANRVRRLGIPILTSHTLLRAIPNEDHTGVIGAVIAECKNFQPVPGTEQVIKDIDLINICTGLKPDNLILEKGKVTFGLHTYGVGDATRVGEGTCAVLRGKQAAMEIAQDLGVRFNYDDYLAVTKDYADSQQHPVRVLDKPNRPAGDRLQKPFVMADCLYGFACNPCTFACPQGAITKSATNCVPQIDYDKCIGCMKCVNHCPGLALFGYNLPKNWLFLPFEYEAEENAEVYLVNDNGQKVGEGIIEKITKGENKTNVARVKALNVEGEALMAVTGFILKERYPKALNWEKLSAKEEDPAYVCHCDDVKIETILAAVKGKKIISVDELKHITRIGMGPCRGKRCIPRVKQLLAGHGVEVVGDATPRGPLSSQLNIGELCPSQKPEEFVTNVNGNPTQKVECDVFVAGGGITGSGLFRYFAEAGKKVVLCNAERGSSWRCIGGGRPSFSVPEIADIAEHNRAIFEEIQKVTNINYKPTRYVGFAHDEANYKALEKSLEWSDGYMVDKKDFLKEVSPYFNPNLNTYQAACITNACWQATPGPTINYIRNIAIEHGGVLLEDTRLLEVRKTPKGFMALVKTHDKQYVEYHCEHFVNALGPSANQFAEQLGMHLGLYPIKHQAFITHRLPMLGKDGDSLDMLIDRRKYKGFSAVYGQQFAETGQIIGCASPATEQLQAGKELKYNTQDFLQVCAEMFIDWIPQLKNVSFQATWAGYYTEPRYIVDPEHGLLVGMRGHGFMLGQYLAKIYVDKYLGKEAPSYMSRLAISGDGLSENAFQ